VSPFLAIGHLTQFIAVTSIKNPLGEKEVDAVLNRLDRLTEEEARTTAAQVLEVVNGLVQDITVAVGGEATFSGLSLT
jgi:hypothetical protein